MKKLTKAFNELKYIYKRQAWMVSPDFWTHKPRPENVTRPIFLVGLQGGGLTLISRMLRRNEDIISVTGNFKYWAGADEMQNVFGPYLNQRLSGIKHHVPQSSKYPDLRGWMYACDDLISKYRLDSNHFNKKDKYKLEKVISWCVGKFGFKKNHRFVDKSQVYTVKISYLRRLLREYAPKFVFVIRNPYAVCYRAPFKSRSIKQLNELDFCQKIRLAAEHWRNSVKSVLQDSKDSSDVKVVRLEDVLRSPKSKVQEICSFVDLKYDTRMLPSGSDTLPLGCKRRNRWHPIRPNINDKYLSEIPSDCIDIISETIGQLAHRFNYTPSLGKSGAD